MPCRCHIVVLEVTIHLFPYFIDLSLSHRTRQNSRTTRNFYMLVGLMWIMTALHLSLNVAGWIHPKFALQKLQTSTVLATLQVRKTSNLSSLCLIDFELRNIFSDSILMWRTWVIWNYNLYILILPVSLACAAYGETSIY